MLYFTSLTFVVTAAVVVCFVNVVKRRAASASHHDTGIHMGPSHAIHVLDEHPCLLRLLFRMQGHHVRLYPRVCSVDQQTYAIVFEKPAFDSGIINATISSTN